MRIQPKGTIEETIEMLNLNDPIILSDAPPRKWSPYQKAIYQAGELSSDNLIIQAVAGSGKSTTLEELSRQLGDSTLLAFNKSIADELKSRGLNARTFHSFGFALWKANAPAAKMDGRKLWKHMDQVLGRGTLLQKEYGTDIARLVGLLKNYALGLSSGIWPAEVEDMMGDYELDIPADLIGEAAAAALKIFLASRDDLSCFDFDDMLYIPVYKNWRFPPCGTLLVDEAQDLNPIQHEIVDRIAQMGSRLIAVGDRWQAIYGFRGAMSDSMDALQRKFSMKELPLSVSYRCSQSVVDEAKTICPQIEAREGAPAGSVGHLRDHPDLWHPAEMIVCRTNAPLFRQVMREIRAERPVRVLSNFLESFSAFVKKHGKGITKIEDFRKRVDAWYVKESEKLDAQGVGKRSNRRAALSDRRETFLCLAERVSTVDELLLFVSRIANSTEGPIFATIHKSKGLEAEKVHLLRPDLVPPPWVDPESPNAAQESNLHYVAVTRAKMDFNYGVKPE